MTTTCLGCSLACDDIAVSVRDGRIFEATNACELGRRWFGDGTVPTRARVRGADAPFGAALAEAASLLERARRPFVYLGPEVSIAAQREVCALADVLGAMLDTVTPAPLVLAIQERGRAGATLGELRHRADIIVFWGFDPDHDYPRLRSRYLPDRDGLQTIAVDFVDDPLAAALTRAAVLGHASEARAEALAKRLVAGKYVAIIVDGEQRPERLDGLLALTEALNGPTRAALLILRGGGNRIGADSVLTWQTGYPRAIDFARGAPLYRPYDSPDDIDVTLVVGTAMGLSRSPTIVIGPRASQVDTVVAIDTGVAGIHEGGVALRVDDIPLPLRPPLRGVAPDAAATVRELTRLVRHP